MGSGLVTPGHLLILLAVVLLVFGPKRLPELGRSIGGGMRGFKDTITGHHEDEVTTVHAAPPASPPAGTPQPPAANAPPVSAESVSPPSARPS